MFEKMRYVHAVYTEGSFTKAAEKLYISQPSLSAAIRRLEDELGMPLFLRTVPIRPTEIGLAYLKTAERIMALEDEFCAGLSRYGALEHGSLCIGGSNLVSSYILPAIISDFSAQYPAVKLTLSEASSAGLMEQLDADGIDLLIDSFDEMPTKYSFQALRNEHILLAVPDSCSVRPGSGGIRPEQLYEKRIDPAALPVIPLEAFREESFILLKSGNSMYEHAMRCFGNAGFLPKVSFFLDQLITSYTLCAGGSGLCFVTDTMFLAHRFTDPVTLYNVGAGMRTLSVVSRGSRKKTPAMEAFIAAAERLHSGTI